MKIGLTEILIKPEDIKYKKNIFLVYGNEETLIKKIESILISLLNKSGFNEKITWDEKNILENFEKDIPTSLFSTSKIMVCNNPKEVNISVLEKINDKNIAIIIVHKSLKSSSKLKINFDSHRDFVSIGCYKINKKLKKNFIDSFLKENKINMEADAYWYLIENSSEIFGLFENDLKKIVSYSKNNISLKEIQLLTSSNVNQDDIEDLFLLNLSSKNIINNSQKLINSPGDLYYLLQKIKFYLYIFFKSKNKQDLEKNLPRYLFAKKQNLSILYNKINNQKYLIILELLKKTELLLRKNEKMYLTISQRFLLNIKKNIK